MEPNQMNDINIPDPHSIDPTQTPGTASDTFASLPDLFATDPPSTRDDAFAEPCRIIDEYLAEYAAHAHVDNIVAAVFTSAGIVYHGGFGRIKANVRPVPGHSSRRGPPKEVDIDTIYRLGSISMLFTVMESILLRRKGLLSWDDPVEKFLPDFKCQTKAWTHRLDFDDEYEEEDPTHNHPITLRMLACHMSGLGTLYPTKIVNNWPINHRGTQDFTNREDIMDCAKVTPPTVLPYSFPIHSSVGISLLGWCNVATEEIAFNRDPTHLKVENHALQLERDVFDPLGMYDSYFDIPERKLERVAVSSFSAPEATLDFTDAYNPVAGQYGSANDLVKFFQFILNPKQPGSLLKAYEVREWLRPIHTWDDGVKEVGAPWEIVKLQDSYGRRRRWFGMTGEMTSYHSAAYINPESSYGIVILLTGRSGALDVFHHIVNTFQPAFDTLLKDRVSDLYTGIWMSEDEETSEVILEVMDGSLKALRLKINNIELLEPSEEYLDGFVPIELWYTGRKDEFRIGFGSEKIKRQPLPGADPYFMGLDGPMAINGFPLNLMVFGYYKDARVMRIPSANAILRR